MNELIRVYVFEGYRDTVIESQVFNWAGALQEKGLRTVGLSITNRRKHSAENIAKLKHISEKYKIDVFSDMFDNYPFVRELQITLAISKLYRRLKKGNTKVVFQTRMPGLILVVPLCRMLLGAKFIIDLRSSPLTEYLYSNPTSSKMDRRRITFAKIENMVVNKSDAVFCVSNVLKQYLLSNYGSHLNSSEKITVIPGAADQKLFFFDSELRNQVRKRLNCQDKIVFTYSGRLDKKWQIPDTVFELIKYLSISISRAFFILLTPDLEIAKRYCQSSGLSEDSYESIYAELDGINPYLNAADYAIILREDLPINHHASPTKISEYLLSGLSVIISYNIGDFSSFITSNNLGCAVDISEQNYKEKVKAYIDNETIPENELQIKRKVRSGIAINSYSKEKYLQIIQKTCKEI